MTGSECWLFFVFGPKFSLNNVHSDTPTKKIILITVPSISVRVRKSVTQRYTEIAWWTSDSWRQDNVKQTDLVTPDGNIPVCNRFIPLDSDLIGRQSSTPNPRRGRRAWSLKPIGNKRKKLKWWIATSREQGWRRDGAVVRALASHQYGPGSTPPWCHTWV